MTVAFAYVVEVFETIEVYLYVVLFISLVGKLLVGYLDHFGFVLSGYLLKNHIRAEEHETNLTAHWLLFRYLEGIGLFVCIFVAGNFTQNSLYHTKQDFILTKMLSVSLAAGFWINALF